MRLVRIFFVLSAIIVSNVLAVAHQYGIFENFQSNIEIFTKDQYLASHILKTEEMIAATGAYKFEPTARILSNDNGCYN